MPDLACFDNPKSEIAYEYAILTKRRAISTYSINKQSGLTPHTKKAPIGAFLYQVQFLKFRFRNEQQHSIECPDRQHLDLVS
jgi:hypothetical protein